MSLMANTASKGQDEGPRRLCIVTGSARPLDSLVRFVIGPEGLLYPDLARKLPGRGIWVVGRRNLVDQAVNRRLFARIAKEPVTVPSDMAVRVERAMVDRCLNFMGLARRAGKLILGSTNVRTVIKRDFTAIVITALDGSGNGLKKLLRGDQGRFIESSHSQRIVVDLFTVSELSLALGRENVVHAALLAGGLADEFLREACRLAQYRDDKVPQA